MNSKQYPIDVDLGYEKQKPIILSDDDDDDDDDDDLGALESHLKSHLKSHFLMDNEDEDELLLSPISRPPKRKGATGSGRLQKRQRFTSAVVELVSEGSSDEEEFFNNALFDPYRAATPSHDLPEFDSEATKLKEPIHKLLLPPLRSSSEVAIPSVVDSPLRMLQQLGLPQHKVQRARFLRAPSTLSEIMHVDKLVRTSLPARAGGSMNKIIQHNGRVVVCSNSAGGNHTGPTDAYNKAGTLISWTKSRPSRIDDLELLVHQDREAALDLPPEVDTSFSMNCVAFEPQTSTLVCSGEDQIVWGWNYDCEQDKYVHGQYHCFEYQGTANNPVVPHDIVLKPNTPSLAVAEKRVTIYSNISYHDGGTHRRLNFPGRNSERYVAGSVAWGVGPSSDYLFVMTEAVAKNDHTGLHFGFDARTGQMSLEFACGRRDGEEGDAMCISQDGGTAALVTKSGVNNSLLRLFDLRTMDRNAVHTLTLTQSDVSLPEVNCMAFSPDDRLLALGRNDNQTHLYDVRFLDRKVSEYPHEPLRLPSDGQEFFGIVDLQWVEWHGRMGLVTGGNDGCVRLFDPRFSAATQADTILAQADSDIAAFSLGDRWQNQHDLVVGDSTGNIFIFDSHTLNI